MVSRTPEEKYRRDINRLLDPSDEQVESNSVTGADLSNADRELIENFARAHDPNDPTVPTEEVKSYNTLARYITNLMRVASRTELDSATTDSLNEQTHNLLQGNRGKSTVRQIQLSLRTFYHYHDDLDVNADKINTFPRPENTVDERDMLTKDEIEAIEDEIDHPRDMCIFHFLLYTGQRVGALRTLRVKDVEPAEGPSGRYWINDTAGGLKGAESDGAGKPLLGAQAAVREWLDYHPTGESEHYLITAKPRYNQIDPTVPVTNETPRRMLKNIKEDIGLDKPLHPHALRHNFVTICKRDFDMADEDIKYLIAHSDSSNVMETTYSHLSSQDHNERVEAAVGETEREPESPLSRDKCRVCGNLLEGGAKACGDCGNVITPDAHAVQGHVEELVPEIQNEDEAKLVSAFLEQMRENPEDYLG